MVVVRFTYNGLGTMHTEHDELHKQHSVSKDRVRSSTIFLFLFNFFIFIFIITRPKSRGVLVGGVELRAAGAGPAILDDLGRGRAGNHAHAAGGAALGVHL